MKNLFFYGTLRHVPLLQIVLGRDVDAADLIPAHLPGYAVSTVQDEPFPMIAQDPSGRAEGLVASGLSEDDVARINFYEGGFAYDLVSHTLEDGRSVAFYLPQPDHWMPHGPRKLEDWCSTWGALSCEAAHEVMSYFGHRSAGEVARMFPVIRARAAARLRGAETRHGALTTPGRIEIAQTSRPYSKFFAVEDVTLRHQKFDGTMSDTIERGVFVAADAAIVLPYDPVTDQVLLVEQIRIGPVMRHDRVAWQLEPVAGRIDPGETPEQAARREALEEAGLTLDVLETIAEVYPTPGNSTEFYYVFMGLCDLSDVKSTVMGLDSEDEDIKTHVLSFDALMRLMQDMAAANAPLVMVAYWLAHHRDRLRSAKAGGTAKYK